MTRTRAERVREAVKNYALRRSILLSDLSEVEDSTVETLLAIPSESSQEVATHAEALRVFDVVTPESDANGDHGTDKGWMGTSTGRKFWPLAPKASDVALADITRGLSMTCRYGGQVKFFYSVAEHCVIVSRHVPAELALKALFHDCAEAYIGDMIRPLKHQAEMSEFRRAEAAIEKAVFEKLRLVVTPEEHAIIKEIDDRILIDEITALSARPDFYLDTPLLRGRKPLGASIVGLMPPLAEDMFCLRYRQITGHAL